MEKRRGKSKQGQDFIKLIKPRESLRLVPKKVRLTLQWSICIAVLLLVSVMSGLWSDRSVRPYAHLDSAQSVLDPPSTKAGHEQMVYIPGGRFQMGFEHGSTDERPLHPVILNPFLLDRFEVTNRQFTAFVRATGHQTQAERQDFCWTYVEGQNDFLDVGGANWLHPEGPGSSIKDRMDHPVVCVSWYDAAAYAAWAGKRLPSEAEWEYAARAGKTAHLVADLGDGDGSAHLAHTSGNSPKIILTQANVWQGTWPVRNHLLDGYYYTAPVGRFEPNGLGLHDIIGNVWEWSADWYSADYYQYSPKENPSGPERGDKKVARGGSWFCSPNYCGAFTSHFRGASPPDHAFNNVGFRCAGDVSSIQSADMLE